MELIYHSKCDLYAEYKCILKSTGRFKKFDETATTPVLDNGSTRYSTMYQFKSTAEYESKPYVHYWLQKDDELIQFISMKQLKKLYAGKKDQFKRYVKKHRITYEDQDGIIDLIRFLDSN